LQPRDYCAAHGLTEERLHRATHIAWATGGRLVPAEVWEEYLGTYRWFCKKNIAFCEKKRCFL